MTSAIADVRVEADRAGDVVVQWAVEGPPTEVDVAVGSSPEGVDHAHAASVPGGETSITLRGLGPGRHFVSVAPHGGGSALIASDRRVGFEGVSNFRDLGGYRTSSGGSTRWGMVFRADALFGLTEGDLDAYRGLGLQVVFDLRGDQEQAEQPNPVESRSVPLVFRRPAQSGTDADVVFRASSIEEGELVLAELYLGHLAHGAARIGEIFSAMAGPEGLPAVFHCHAGKDRTGIVAALLLELLGVDRSTILDDYELTARYRLRTHQEGTFQRLVDNGMAPDAAAGVLTTPRWAMGDALVALDEEYGGVDAFLLGPGGMEPAHLETLRRTLVSC